MPNRKRDSEGRFASGGSFIEAMRDRPYAAAGVAAGVAAAGASFGRNAARSATWLRVGWIG